MPDWGLCDSKQVMLNFIFFFNKLNPLAVGPSESPQC